MSTHEPHSTPQPGYGGDPVHGAGSAPAYGNPAGYGQPGGSPYGNQYSPQRAGTQPGVAVGFVEAVKRYYSKYAQFSGRASRSEYWWVALYLGAIYIVLSILSAAGTDAYGQPNGFGVLVTILMSVFALAHLVPSIAIGIRRLHDVNLSGWFYLLALIPFLGTLVLLVLMVLPPKPEGARFDR